MFCRIDRHTNIGRIIGIIPKMLILQLLHWIRPFFLTCISTIRVSQNIYKRTLCWHILLVSVPVIRDSVIVAKQQWLFGLNSG
jgi:hypothetical protein